MFTLAHFGPLRVAVGPANGPPLLLLHGVLRDGRDFAGVWPALLPRWHVHAADQRGHGGSPRRPGEYFVRHYAADAVELVRDHLPPNLVLFGHSLGALVAAHVAAVCPDRVSAIVLEDPPSAAFLRDVPFSTWHGVWSGMRELAGSAGPTSAVARKLADLRQGTTRLGDLRDGASLRFSASCLKDIDPDVFAPLLAGQWLDGFDLDAALAGVRCPALILRGDPALGGMLRRDEAEAMVGRMADAILADVPNVGHLIHAAAPEATLRLVLPFLESML